MGFLRACLAVLLGVMLVANAAAQNGGSETMLDTLFAKLQGATDPMAIQTLETAIWEQWTLVPEGQPRELMMRGIAEMQQRDPARRAREPRGDVAQTQFRHVDHVEQRSGRQRRRARRARCQRRNV